MSKINFTFKGVMAPVFTPFNNDESRSLNLSIIPEYARFLARKNINGILVNGTTGEGTSLSKCERKQVVETWVAAVQETKQHLMVQVGGTNLSDIKELASHAENLGVDSLLCLPELYFRPTTVTDLIEYLKIVGGCAPKTPLLYYHFPKQSAVDIHMGQFLESVGGKIPTFSGIKFTSSDLEEAYRAMIANRNLTVFLGSDVLMAAGCTIGLDSFILTSLNFLSEPALEILEFGKGNINLRSAQKNQDYINKIINKITCHGAWVETMKIVMSLTTNFFMGPPRTPNKLLAKENVEVIVKDLSELGLSINKTAVINMYLNCK